MKHPVARRRLGAGSQFFGVGFDVHILKVAADDRRLVVAGEVDRRRGEIIQLPGVQCFFGVRGNTGNAAVCRKHRAAYQLHREGYPRRGADGRVYPSVQCLHDNDMPALRRRRRISGGFVARFQVINGRKTEIKAVVRADDGNALPARVAADNVELRAGDECAVLAHCHHKVAAVSRVRRVVEEAELRYRRRVNKADVKRQIVFRSARKARRTRRIGGNLRDVH